MNYVTYNIDTSSINCLGTFLKDIAIQITSFIQFYNNTLYFAEGTDPNLIQNFIDNFNCETANQNIENNQTLYTDVIKKNSDPTIYENPSEKGIVWINSVSGDSFICINNTPDANVWVGMKTGRLIRPVPPADKFDFFGDNSCVLFSELNGNANDVGGLYNGSSHNISWERVFDHKIANSRKNGTIKFKNLPFDSTTAATTISAWVQWNGKNSVMPFGWTGCDLWCERGNLGFNTFQSDLYGVNFTPYKKQWVYLTVVFLKNSIGKIFINGAEQILSEKRAGFQSTSMVMDSQFSVFGSNVGSGYRKFGSIGRLRIFNRELTPSEVGLLTQAEVDMITYLGGSL